MTTVFLSASVPLKSRHPRYFQSVDVVAVREAIKGLVLAVLPRGKIVFGGHPAITPMIRLLAKSMDVAVRDHVVLYQSAFFEHEMPQENAFFEQVIIVPAAPEGREHSLRQMRERMFTDHDFDVGVFIGGMEGVEDEFDLFREKCPERPFLPIASTGAAAGILYEREHLDVPALKSELAYLHLFRTMLPAGG